MTAAGERQDAWPAERIERFRQLWPQFELSAAEIGRQLGVSKNAVVGKAHRLGLEPRPSPIHAGAGAYGRAAAERRRAAARQFAGSGATLPALASLSAAAVEKSQRPRRLPIKQTRKAGRLPSGVETHRLGGHVVPLHTLQPMAAAPVAPPRPVHRLSRFECTFPLNDGKPWKFCEAPTVHGRPFCPDHCRRAYTGRADGQ